MKTIKRIIVVLVLALTLAACGGGNAGDVTVLPYSSEMYADDEIEAAIDAAIAYFEAEFEGCTLTEITYAGDERTSAHAEWAERHDADEAIVLLSSFDVGESGGDGSLNPNSTYRNWMWIMVGADGGPWVHADHGY